MRCVIQRVTEASVKVGGETVGQIGKGFMVLIGVSVEDTDKDLKYMAEKVPNLRIFEDEQGKMNLSLKDVGGAILATPGAAAGPALFRRPGLKPPMIITKSWWQPGAARASRWRRACSGQKCRWRWSMTAP